MNIKVPKFLIKIVDKIFNRKKKVIPISIKIPTREELINNNENEKVELLDKYKKDYIEKLRSKLLFSIISSEKLINDYKMNQEITLKHLKDNKYNNVSDIIGNGNVKELLEVKLEFFKLFILTEQSKSLYNEIILRIAALNEISEGELIILPRKKRAILNEYDTLYTGLIVTTSSRYASIQDTEIYLIRMNEINKYIKNITNEEQKLLNERKELVIKIANIFIKDKLDSVSNNNVNDIGLIAYLEIELEKYLYEHKEEFKLLDTELNNIKREELNKDNKEGLLKQIEELELKYLLLNMFNSMSKSVFEKLYKIKFNIITLGINLSRKPVISKEDYGYEYYKNIVSRKISLLLNGNNENFNDTFASLDGKSNAINDYFISADEVLNSAQKLAVLLSFDMANGFDNLLNNTLINKDNINLILSFGSEAYSKFYKSFFQGKTCHGIEWNNYIPLKSILEIMSRKEYRREYKPLTYLYSLSDLIYPYRQLPDGIIKLVPASTGITYIDWYRILPDVEPLTSKEFILPRTIKEYDNYNMYYYYVNELPSGIEKITFHINQNIPPIPPTVSEIKLLTHGNERKNPLVLTFLDFKYSLFLCDKNNIINLLDKIRNTNFIELENNGQVKRIKVSDLNNDKTKNDIIRLATTFVKEKVGSINNTKDMGTIVYLKIVLEKYLIEHKEEFDLEFISKELTDISNRKFDNNSIQELLKQIEVIESKMLLKKIIDYIPEELVTKLDDIKYDLYYKKLKILTSDTYDLNSIDKDEYEYYEKIIKRKFRNIIFSIRDNFDARSIMDEIRYCLAYYEKERLERSFIYLFTNEYFYGCSYPDENMVWFNPYEHGYGTDFRYLVPDDILKNKFKINVLLSLETVNDFIEMINNTVINKKDLETLLLIYPDEDYWKYSINSRNNSFDRAGNTQLKCLLEKIMEKRCSPYGHLWEYDHSQDEHNGFLFDLYRLLIFHRECWNNETKLNNVKNNQARVLTKK